MEKPTFKLVGAPCGQHGQYTFYKAIRLTGERDRIVAIGDFFFVRIWQDSELVSIGELQLLWTDRVSDQTLVSLRLYFLPENTPDGRSQHGEDEVLAINDKVVVRAEDLLSWVSDGVNWRWGLRAVWRGACAPPADPRHTVPLHHTKLDFSDVDREKSTIAVDADCPGVVVFSYPRYCRYRALMARLEGIQGDWLRDSLVAALGGYAAPTKNTRILYCKETFEYPELEGHEFVCNHLAPRLKGRPRGRRRRAPRSPLSPRSRTRSRSDRSSDSDVSAARAPHAPRTDPMTPRRLSLRNGAPARDAGAPPDVTSPPAAAPSPALDKAFLQHLRHFYTQRNLHLNTQHAFKHLSLRGLYAAVWSRGGYEAVCRHKLWRSLSDQPARTRRHYERFLLPYENHERRNGTFKINGKIDEPHTIDTIDVTDSPLRDIEIKPEITDKILRTPSPKHEKFIDNETGEVKEELNVISKPAEELNREFLDSLPKEDEKLKISVKPVEKLIEPKIVKLFEENSALISELVVKHNLSDSSKVIAELGNKQLSHDSTVFLSELAQKLDLSNPDTTLVKDPPVDIPPATITVTENSLNGHEHNALSKEQQKCRPAGRSSLRAVRVKPTRAPHTHTHAHTHAHSHTHSHPHTHTHTHTHSHSAPPSTPPVPPLRPESASSSPPAFTSAPLNNFGIHHPPLVRSNSALSDDEIVEVPYRPKTPEIIDLDEYPESPQQSVKKKKLDILKERGLEVTALPNTNWTQPLNPIPPLLNPPMILNPAMQHQIMTQAQLFQMYNIIPPNYSNGIQPPKVIQATSIFGSAGPEKTVYGNPKDPFMPPPHVLLGTPVKSQRIPPSTNTPPHDILDLTCRDASPQKPAVEIVRIPNSPSPSKSAVQNLPKNYTLIDGKAVVGSNLEITLVNKVQQTPSKNRPPQKRSSNGKFMSTKTPTPPKIYACPSPSNIPKKPQIVVPNYQINREDISPTSSTGSTNSQSNLLPSNMPNPYKNNLAQIMEMQKTAVPMTSFMDPYMALYSSLAGQMDQRQLAVYRDLMANQFRGYTGLLNLGAVANTPTTKN